MKFDVKKHLIKVQGGREYLPVAYRLVWFRAEHPDWGVDTKVVQIDVERGVAVFQAHVYDAEGRLVASGTKMETARGFGDYVEKAETGSIGRALGVLGYGTQFAPEFDEGTEQLADSPMPIGEPANGRVQKPARSEGKVENIGRDFASCAACGRPLTKPQETLSTTRFGQPLCPAHQKQAGTALPI